MNVQTQANEKGPNGAILINNEIINILYLWPDILVTATEICSLLQMTQLITTLRLITILYKIWNNR